MYHLRKFDDKRLAAEFIEKLEKAITELLGNKVVIYSIDEREYLENDCVADMKIKFMIKKNQEKDDR